jgi:hypothetical protein
MSPEGGLFASQCASAPCGSGIVLCVSNSGCRSSEICAPYAVGAVLYGLCAMTDAGADDGGQRPDGRGLDDGGSQGDRGVSADAPGTD